MTQETMTALTAIADEISTCTKCALHTGRTNTVPGAGDPNADILFIGEGPGFHEDKQGLPFVGRSGDYLNYLLEKIGLNREEVFITNVVKCRPPNNRDPLPDEIVACKAYLDRQIALIDPLVIATLGRFSMARYFPNARISQIHGQPRYDERRAYFPLYHPAAALRNPKLRHDMEADFRHLLEVMHEMRDKRNAATESPPIEAEHDDPEEPPQQLKLF